jgi:peptidoglycan hydrolase-like protein with peptidoglycan-binding domain
MTPLRLQLGLLAFAALTSLTLVNVMYVQSTSGARASRVELGRSSELDARTPARRPAAAAEQPAVSAAAVTAETIKALRRELEARGYATGGSDGSVTIVLRAAIMAYESDHDLAVTAEPSANLLETVVLGSAMPGRGVVTGKLGPEAEQVVRTVQQSLHGLGIGPLKIDGFPGEATVQAIRRFERDQKLSETGRISGQLVIRLAQLASLGQVHSRR